MAQPLLTDVCRDSRPFVLAGMVTRQPEQYLWASMRGHRRPRGAGELRRQQPDRCQASGDAKGTLKKGSGLAGAGIGTVTSLTFKGCAVSVFNVSLTLSGKMPLNATKYSGTTKVANMTIAKFHATLSASSLGCSATIDGTGATAHNGMVKAKFSNKTNTLQVLATGGNLKLYHVSSGCSAGNIHNGDLVNFTGSYKLTPKQTITSP